MKMEVLGLMDLDVGQTGILVFKHEENRTFILITVGNAIPMKVVLFR